MQYISIFGLIAFGIVLYQNSVIKGLKKDIRFLKSKVKTRGADTMSKVLNGLQGQQCKLIYTNDLDLSANNVVCTILESDDDFIKFLTINKKNEEITKVIRIDNVIEITPLNK